MKYYILSMGRGMQHTKIPHFQTKPFLLGILPTSLFSEAQIIRLSSHTMDCFFCPEAILNSRVEIIFFIMYSRKVQVKYRYEAPREEPREAHGYEALDYDGYMVALSVSVILWESVKEN